MDQQTFAAEVLAAEKQLYGVAKSILKNDADCEDAVQSAILNAYANLSGLKNERFFRTWLTRILINECYGVIRRNKTMIATEDVQIERMAEDGGAKGSVGDDGEHSETYEALMELKEQYRLPLVLHYVEGYSVKEVAGILKISENGVKQRLFRARGQMREKLKGER